ncbi:MAG: ribose-5-phosphate isomerase [Elusimicrobia bacterium GWA2_61_42]|nr:MAG: ribose-5-phosphate isomerase [Elusimicrobia bacterium GWA2_61_42]OGR79751.1 MAG: ribose-5-phosphate isomerase [Elusimicrobia bacterium GWC2_61_25]
MKIAIASDHAGYPLKAALAAYLETLGHEVADLGTNSPDVPVDYPDFAAKAAREVLAGRALRAIVVCGSGVGACVAANKLKGIRAGLCHDTYSAHQGVEHDDMNVLCLGARIIGPAPAFEIAAAFLGASFSGEDRHKRRLKKIEDLERGA